MAITTLLSGLRPSFSHYSCYVRSFYTWVAGAIGFFEKLFHESFIYSQNLRNAWPGILTRTLRLPTRLRRLHIPRKIIYIYIIIYSNFDIRISYKNWKLFNTRIKIKLKQNENVFNIKLIYSSRSLLSSFEYVFIKKKQKKKTGKVSPTSFKKFNILICSHINFIITTHTSNITN